MLLASLVTVASVVLLTAFYREGRPSVSVLPAGRNGAFVVAWEGPSSGWGTKSKTVVVPPMAAALWPV